MGKGRCVIPVPIQRRSGEILDSDEDNDKLSLHFVEKGMSDLSPSQLIDLLTEDDQIVQTSAGFLLHRSGGDSGDFDRIAGLASHADAYMREVAAHVPVAHGTGRGKASTN